MQHKTTKHLFLIELSSIIRLSATETCQSRNLSVTKIKLSLAAEAYNKFRKSISWHINYRLNCVSVIDSFCAKPYTITIASSYFKHIARATAVTASNIIVHNLVVRRLLNNRTLQQSHILIVITSTRPLAIPIDSIQVSTLGH